jgi:glycosyltransferase involved in cell wall biosynthesis
MSNQPLDIANSANSYLSIVVPMHDEEDNVEILYRELRDSVDKIKKAYEIILVDDGSTDETLKRMRGIKEKEKEEGNSNIQTRIIQFARNFGQTAAMQAGFDHARGEIIVSLDGDLQNDPADIPKLISKLNEGYDVVCGWRKERKDKALTRVLPSKVANWMIGKVTGVPIHDNGCSLKAYRSSVIKSIKLYSDMHRFIPAMSTMADARIAEVVVNHRPRKYGEAKYGLSRIWKVLSDIVTIKMLIHFRNQPIFWFALLSVIFAFFGLGFGIVSIVTYIEGLKSIVYPAASFLFLSLFASFLSWGILAEFLIRQEKK